MRSVKMFYIALSVGLLFCIFWTVQLVFVALHLSWSSRIIESDEEDADIGVSVIHPIKDLDFELEQNLESWFNQNFKGKVEHIFSFQDPDDPAIPVVRNFLKRYPSVDAQIIVNPVIEGLNGKSSNMVNGMKISKYEYVLFGDSDIRVQPDFIVKMIRPLKNEKVGITTCGQINVGGRDFWTRFFTFLQNYETVFVWALMTKLGLDFGATGAAFAMRKKLLQDVGGLEAFGNSLLEDFHLGNHLYKLGYKLYLGPFIYCHVDKLGKEKSFNYAKRISIGIKTYLAVEIPAFAILLGWYWILFILGVIFRDPATILLCIFFMILRSLDGILMRIVAKSKIHPLDIIMGLYFDIFGLIFLFYGLKNPFVDWRGIKYRVEKGGYIYRDNSEDSGKNISEGNSLDYELNIAEEAEKISKSG